MIKTFSGIQIRGISAAVPKLNFEISSLAPLFGENEIQRIMRGTGIERSRTTDENTTASDLCYEAASDLLSKLKIAPSSIDALIFISTTPDYMAPATSHILQNRLGLSTSVPCFDLTFGCSAFTYGLLQSALLLTTQTASRVLVLMGETPTKLLREEDRATRTIFGDAGAAMIVDSHPEGQRAGAMTVSAYSDGAGHQHMIIPNSGLRHKGSDKFFNMNGFEVFSFATKVVPGAVEALLKQTGSSVREIDGFVFHQANKMINDFVAKKLEIPGDKIATSLREFGNTGGASIPLSMIVDPKFASLKKNKIVACGFGVGLSWGAAEVDLSETYFSSLVEV